MPTSMAEDSHNNQVLDNGESVTREIKAEDPMKIKVDISDDSVGESEKMNFQERTTLQDKTELCDVGDVTFPRLENERQFFSESSSPNRKSGASPRSEKMTVQKRNTLGDEKELCDVGDVTLPRLENERQFFSESSSPNSQSGASPRTRRKSKTNRAWKTFLKNA